MRALVCVIGGLIFGGIFQAEAQPAWGFANLAQVKDATSKRASSSDPNWANAGNADARPIEPGATLVLADLEGPGVINHIWFTIAANEEKYSQLLALRVYWDGETHPSVETPIGDFFAMGHGVDETVASLPVSVTSDGRGRNCYWPMPFGKRARLEVTNEGSKPVGAFYYYIDWEQVQSLPSDTAYFHAMYRQEYPARLDSRYMWADIEGRGHYVGTVHSVRARTASWLGEGDDFFYLDGEKEPSLKGTGTEDYFCDGWGFREADRPFYGIPLFEGYEAGDRTTVYRWHITDPIRFSKSLYAEIEHVGPLGLAPDGSFAPGYGTRLDDIASVAFWYQVEPHKVWEPMPIGAARVYPEDVASLYLQPDAYPPYIDLALQMTLQDASTENIILTAGGANDASFSLEARNPTELPLHVVFNFAGAGQLKPAQTSYEASLAPGEERAIPISFEGVENVPTEHLQPIRVRANYQFQHPSGKTVTIPVDRHVIFSAEYAVSAPTQPVTIDGKLLEWGDLAFVVRQPAQIQFEKTGWQGPEDCQWRFDVRADAAFLYVAVDVVDDELVLAADPVPWLQDGVEIRVAALPDSERDAYAGQDEFGRALLFALAPNKDGQPAQAYHADLLPKDARYACIPTDSGFAAEVAIPKAWLDAQQGKPWDKIRLNIAVDDRDGEQQTQLWWRPDWRSKPTFAGSGTFVRH